MKKIFASIAVTLAFLAFAPSALAVATTLTVNPDNQQGWLLNPDASNDTAYTFTNAYHSLGTGSLYAGPIDSTAAHKFIAVKPLGILVSDLSSLSYDFKIAGNGDVGDANQFYLNIYTNVPSSTTYYDCRFDYVATTGSTSNFTTAIVNAGDVPTAVSSHISCPATLAGMPEGSHISAVAFNIGDTGSGDVGLAGYLDKFIVTTISDQTTYDFEPIVEPTVPEAKDACKKDGWMSFLSLSFRNQGQCISYVVSNDHAGKR